jgi:hypothetical protein
MAQFAGCDVVMADRENLGFRRVETASSYYTSTCSITTVGVPSTTKQPWKAYCRWEGIVVD